MDAKELRIGNYVEFMGKHIPIDIERLRDTYFNNACSQPIPLTEEWLVKFGFEITESDVNCDINDSYRSYTIYEKGLTEISLDFDSPIEPDRFFYYAVTNNMESFIEIKHVHQLQNLYFALTGKELTLQTNEA